MFQSKFIDISSIKKTHQQLKNNTSNQFPVFHSWITANKKEKTLHILPFSK